MAGHVVVLVLGDMGRSPRMQYHALSLTGMKEIERVTMVGYKGEQLILPLRSSSKLRVKYIQQPAFIQLFKSIRVVFAIAKGVGLMLGLLYILFTLPSYQLIVIQNPPSLPALFAALLVRTLRPYSIMIDWHNLAFSMYEFSVGKGHVLTRLTYLLEGTLAPYAQHHIAVSQTMSEWLKRNFHVNAVVCYDKPARIFSKTLLTDSERHNLLNKYNLLEEHYSAHNQSPSHAVEETIQTIQTANGEVERKLGHGRCALVVSSTSWTSDEDFFLLYHALLSAEHILSNLCDEQRLKHYHHFDRILVVITGKGELKNAFEQLITTAYSERKLGKHVFVQTAWLETEDYPRILQCADLGVSLHASTSGRDLPMKVVDMFGAGLPVLALNFPALKELVQNEYNGLIFQSSNELVEQMLKVLFDIKVKDSEVSYHINDDSTLLTVMKKNLKHIERWDEHWGRMVKPIVQSILDHNPDL